MSFEGDLLEDHPLIRVRYEKAQALRDLGLSPFVNRFEPTHKAGDLQADGDRHAAEETPVRVAGRMLTVKSFGSLSFFHLQDGTGRVQVAVHKKSLPEADMELFKKSMDAGDWIGAEGTMTRTKTGELTVHAHRIYLLAKSMRALPEKFHGLRDQELRYRQRYVDLVVNPEVKEVFERRSRVVGALRRNLEARGYIEVETPMMQMIYGGAAARPFVTHHNTLDMDLYLRIAPELYLKRLLVGGFERVYEINRNFRNEGLSVRHNPEFTMLELYTAYWDYTDTMRLTEELIQQVAQDVCGTLELEYQEKPLSFAGPWARRPILDLIRETLNVDLDLRWGMNVESAWLNPLLAAVPDEVRNVVMAKTHGREKTADEILFSVFEEVCEKTLWQPTFVMDFPRSLCPLAKSKTDDPATAERFELFMGGLECGNAYSELNDPYDQLKRFREQANARQAGDEEAVGEVDADYVRALEYGMPPASGLGIGIDRLVMLLTNSASIRDVILFPQMRAEE